MNCIQRQIQMQQSNERNTTHIDSERIKAAVIQPHVHNANLAKTLHTTTLTLSAVANPHHVHIFNEKLKEACTKLETK